MRLNEEINRIKSLMGLITENLDIFNTPKFITKKEDLDTYFSSIGMEGNKNYEYDDIDRDGQKDMLLTYYTKGNVIIYAGICNHSNGTISYLLNLKTKPDYKEIIKPTFYYTIDEIDKKVKPMIDTSHEATQLDYLGIKEKNDYIPSKAEYDKLINDAIDNKDWDKMDDLQKRYGKLFN